MLRIIGGRNRRVEFTDAATDDDENSTATFSGVSFGEPSERRHIIVGFRGSGLGPNTDDPDSCTIGGVPATAVVLDGGYIDGWRQIWIAAVPTGTSGTVTVSRNGDMNACAAVVWAAYDLSSATPFATASGEGTPTADLSLNVPGGGIVVGFGFEGDSGTPGQTWSGLTEDVEMTVGGDTVRFSGASASKVPAATPRLVTITNDDGGEVFGVAASWL